MNYRYRLGRLTGVCPQCRRHTFKYYIDTVTGAKAGDYLGRCNREVKCGYHRRPTGNRPLTAAEATTSLFDRPADDALSTIPREVYERLPPVNTDDNLCHYLSRRYGIGMVQQACRYFGVSHARFAGGSSAFWLIDRMGYIRSAKVMAYDRATGHRVKSTNRMPVSYAHALMRLPDFNYRACYFGEAAACDRLHADAKLILVESEKTALVVNLELMRCGRSADYVCVATGGASMLRVDRDDGEPILSRHIPARTAAGGATRCRHGGHVAPVCRQPHSLRDRAAFYRRARTAILAHRQPGHRRPYP